MMDRLKRFKAVPMGDTIALAHRGRREMQRGKETWCDSCRTWVLLKAIEEHFKEDDHVEASRKADTWKV
jgi:hypothetical protein